MNIYSSADKGGNSAWKGFSSQTIYIAKRLIFEKDISLIYYPESIEDLKIQDENGSVVELVQVKNLSSKLTLSDLQPQKEGSFFKRVLSIKHDNHNFKVRLVSYGDIGPELLDWNKNNNKMGVHKDNITDKLESYKYSSEDIKWLRENIIIEKHDESELKNQIFVELEKNIETAISPEIIFDILVSYISRLSRNQMNTSKIDWLEKLRALSLSLASISGWKNQFGKTILPLSEYRNFDSSSIELHRKEYENGVSALPQHIFNDFDIPRRYWLNILDENFKKHNLTIIHGSSGQGKSSLAYRYLFDNYAANEVFIVSGISNQQQAIDISTALRELEKNEFNMIVYIDVRPYDGNWVWLIEQISTLNLSMPVLVTLREEDFNRNPIDKNYIKYNDIQLTLNEVEARDLYERYPTDKYLTFEDSWKNFGEYNLLMEYIFFLRENESLKTRLLSQIDRLILEEENIDNWLLALLIISYAGRKEVPINAKKLLKDIEIKNHLRMLLIFNQEYWVRSIDDNKTLSSLHPVRAMLLYDILIKKILITEEDVLLQSVQFTDYYPRTLLIDYFYSNLVNLDFIEKLSTLSYTTWATYAGVLESILWLSVWKYYKKYETIIEQGNLLTNNTFAFIMITNITGYLEFDNQYMIDMLKKQNPKIFHEANKLLDGIEEKTINYMLVDEFLKNTMDRLPLDDVLTSDTLTYCGFTLFWFAKRDIFLKESIFISAIDKVDYSDSLAVCELALGIQKQGWQGIYNCLLTKIKPLITKQLNIVYLNDEEKTLQAYAINDISGNDNNHTKTMLAVDALRMLYSKKEEYHVTLIGSDIIEGIPVFDNIKTIKKDKLPYKWITRLNGWFIKMDEYKYLLENWKDVYEEILRRRQEIQEISTYLIKAIDDYFKKRRLNRFKNKEYTKKENQFKTGNYILTLPKCAANKYGMSTGISNFTDIAPFIKRKTEQQEYQGDKEYFSILKVSNDYIQDFQLFLTQKNQLLQDKMQNESTSNIGRLSYVNLMFALEKLPKMLDLFEIEFSKFISMDNFDKNEVEELFLLGIMWEHVCNVSCRVENSVMYGKKKEKNNKKNIIKSFINETICDIQGVEQVVYSDNREVFVLLDILHIESFIADIFLKYTNLFPKLDYGTFDYALFSLLIKKINVQYCYNSEPTIGGFQIRTLDFTKEDKDSFLESVMRTSIGFDNFHWDITKGKIKYILTILGLIESFNFIFRHVEDVINHLSKIEKNEYLQTQVLGGWKVACDSRTKDLFKDINETCEILQVYLMNEKQKEILDGFAKVTNSLFSIDDLFLNLVVNKDKIEEEFSINNYKEAFIEIVDILLVD